MQTFKTYLEKYLDGRPHVTKTWHKEQYIVFGEVEGYWKTLGKFHEYDEAKENAGSLKEKVAGNTYIFDTKKEKVVWRNGRVR
jgi:hypothetical protein|tara:strand:+ start:234 stop:482 length:249 start_codon:yes stop_codon:yes gene_type:complete